MIGEKTKFGRLASSKWIKTGLGTKFLDESPDWEREANTTNSAESTLKTVFKTSNHSSQTPPQSPPPPPNAPVSDAISFLSSVHFVALRVVVTSRAERLCYISSLENWIWKKVIRITLNSMSDDWRTNFECQNCDWQFIASSGRIFAGPDVSDLFSEAGTCVEERLVPCGWLCTEDHPPLPSKNKIKKKQGRRGWVRRLLGS